MLSLVLIEVRQYIDKSGKNPFEKWFRSLSAEDIVPTDLVYRERVGETYGFLYNPKHRWYYFPRLERNEPILLKCYDSKDDGRALHRAYLVR